MPISRKEFERNMFLLSEGFEKDIIRISNSCIKSAKGLENARFAPNQRANLNTVNEMARLFANSTAQMILQKESRSIETGA